MAEQTTPPAGTEAPPEGAAEPKTFDADYVDKLRKEAAKYRTEAQANSGAAAKLAVIEEAQKSEAQKSADRLAVAEKAAADAMREALKFKIAAKFQVDDADADLFLTGADEDTMTRQAQRLSGREAERKKNGNHVPREGTTTTSAESDERAFARQVFGND